MTKENEIEDIKMVDVPETQQTDMSAVEKAVETAFYATEKGKRDLALSESRGHRLAAAYVERDELRDRLVRAEEEIKRLGGLLDVIRRCADDESFDIIFQR